MDTDPAVQVESGQRNLLVMTRSGKVFAFGNSNNGVVQNKKYKLTDNYEPEAKLVLDLPSDIVQINMYQDNGGSSGFALTQSGQIWCWGGDLLGCGDYGDGFEVEEDMRAGWKIGKDHPVPLSWTPPDGSVWLDFSVGGARTLFARTTSNKLYGMGQDSGAQSIGGPEPTGRTNLFFLRSAVRRTPSKIIGRLTKLSTFSASRGDLIPLAVPKNMGVEVGVSAPMPLQ